MTRRPIRRSQQTARKKAPQEITESMTVDMATYRKEELNTFNRPIERKNFPEGADGDTEYREALLDQYKKLRDKEYRYTVQNEAMKVYNLACDGRSNLGSNKGHENKHVWNAYKGTSFEVAARDTAVVNIPTMVRDMGWNPDGMCRTQNKDKKGQVKSVGAYSCAIVGSAIQMEVSNKMGYTGDNNFVDAASSKTPLASASGAVTCVDDKYQIQGKGKTLNQMVLSGQLSLGDEVSIRTSDNPDVATASGCHVLTITDIKYDYNGNIKNYTIQASNNCSYTTVDPKKNSYPGNKLVQNAAQTHLWINEKINEERQNLASLSNEELAQRVQETKERTEGVIDNLQTTESYAATHKRGGKSYISGIQTQYNQDYQDMKLTNTIMHQEPIVIRKDKESPEFKFSPALDVPLVDPETGKSRTFAERMKLAEELKAQQGSTLPSMQAELANGTMAIATGIRTATTTLGEPDVRPVDEAMRQDAAAHGVSVNTGQTGNEPLVHTVEVKEKEPQTTSVEQVPQKKISVAQMVSLKQNIH